MPSLAELGADASWDRCAVAFYNEGNDCVVNRLRRFVAPSAPLVADVPPVRYAHFGAPPQQHDAGEADAGDHASMLVELENHAFSGQRVSGKLFHAAAAKVPTPPPFLFYFFVVLCDVDPPSSPHRVAAPLCGSVRVGPGYVH